MSRLVRGILALGFMLGLVGCEQEDPNPEARDPIFSDLSKRQTDYEKTVEEATAKVKDLAEKLERTEANSLALREVTRDLGKARTQKLDSEQWARYYKIRAERRRLVDKLVYKEAFHAHKPWPDPHEYSDYLTNQRLVEANPNWNVRVPKLQSRLPSAAGEKKPEPKKEE